MSMRSSPNRRVVPLAAAVVAAALGGGACSQTDDRPAVWTYVSAELFQPSCATASCHSRGSAVAGLDFSDPERGYRSLTGLEVWIPDTNGTLSGECKTIGATVYCISDRALVTAFDPASSRLVSMLRARGGAPRMPPDRPLPEADIQLVEAWIQDGARETPGGAPAGSGSPDGGADAASDGGRPETGNADGGDARTD